MRTRLKPSAESRCACFFTSSFEVPNRELAVTLVPQNRATVPSSNASLSPCAFKKPRLPAGTSGALRKDRSTGEVFQGRIPCGQADLSGSSAPALDEAATATPARQDTARAMKQWRTHRINRCARRRRRGLEVLGYR